MATKDIFQESLFRETPKETIQKSFANFRKQSLDFTRAVSDLSGEDAIAGRYSTEFLKTISSFEEEIDSPTKLHETVPNLEEEALSVEGLESISSETLYETLSGEYYEGTYIQIINIFKKYLDNLVTAIKAIDDDVTRENEMAQFTRMFYELDYIPLDDQNFDDIVNTMRVCTIDKITPYSLEQIVTLRSVLNDLMQNMNVTEKKYFELLDKLEEHYNTTGPLSGLDHSSVTIRD